MSQGSSTARVSSRLVSIGLTGLHEDGKNGARSSLPDLVRRRRREHGAVVRRLLSRQPWPEALKKPATLPLLRLACAPPPYLCNTAPAAVTHRARKPRPASSSSCFCCSLSACLKWHGFARRLSSTLLRKCGVVMMMMLGSPTTQHSPARAYFSMSKRRNRISHNGAWLLMRPARQTLLRTCASGGSGTQQLTAWPAQGCWLQHAKAGGENQPAGLLPRRVAQLTHIVLKIGRPTGCLGTAPAGFPTVRHRFLASVDGWGGGGVVELASWIGVTPTIGMQRRGQASREG